MRARRSTVAGSAPTTFPGFAHVAEIAVGPFASVYRAIELGTGRSVALKVLRLAGTSPHVAEVFDKELTALARLSNHPHVTTLYRTFFTPEGRPVLVLELCRESLAQRVSQRGPMPLPDVLEVGVKIAGALGTAHRAGLLHRDVKPQNILVSEFGEPVLGDFGVAALQTEAQSTEGMFGFTTLHAPPEALEGLPLSPAADIYGLASSMYQLALGRGPFAAYEGEAPASVILRVLRDPAPRLPASVVPIDLADLFEMALAKDPGHRPQSADEFAAALRAIEARADWAQTPYLVWGEAPTADATPPGPVPEQVSVPAGAGAHAGPGPGPDLDLGLEQEHPAACLSASPGLATYPWRPPLPTLAAAPLPAPPPPAAQAAPYDQPPPPGLRRVIGPPPTPRRVVVPVAAAPAEPPPPPPPPPPPRP